MYDVEIVAFVEFNLYHKSELKKNKKYIWEKLLIRLKSSIKS